MGTKHEVLILEGSLVQMLLPSKPPLPILMGELYNCVIKRIVEIKASGFSREQLDVTVDSADTMP